MLKESRRGALPRETSDATERALAALERVRPRLRRLMALFRIPIQDAEDLAQNLAIAALTRGHNAERMENWLMGAAWNLCRMYLRNKMQKEMAALDSIPEPLVDSSEIEWIEQIDLERCLLTLSPNHQAVFRLLFAGYRNQEAAALAGFSEKSIRKLIRRCTGRLSARVAALNRQGLGTINAR